MPTYAVGDIHGCLETLHRLLDAIDPDPEHDRLWLVGDLVNRGPDSLGVLRWARALHDAWGERLVVVLGNHDLHLLAIHAGIAEQRPGDTLYDLLRADDCDALIRWLGNRPLLHRDGDYLLVHAGLLPSWSADDAERRARSVEAALRGEHRTALLRREPASSAELDLSREYEALAAFARLRTCTTAGAPCSFTGPPEQAPPDCLAWFDIPGRRAAETTIVCGHWAALGLRNDPNLVALDTGCAWGRELTAVRLDDRKVFRQATVEEGLEVVGVSRS